MTVNAQTETGAIKVTWDTGRHTNQVVRSDRTALGPQDTPFHDKCPPCKRKFTYSVVLPDGSISNPSNTVTLFACCSTHHSTYLIAIGQDIPESPFGSFVLLIPFQKVVLQYLLEPGNIVKASWRFERSLQILPQHVVLDTSLSLIQSPSTKLEAIVQVGDAQHLAQAFGSVLGLLLGYELTPGGEWSAPFPLQADDGPLDKVTGSQALIQSNRGGQDQFELLVPRSNAIYHYTNNATSIVEGRWTLVAELPPPLVGVGAFVPHTDVSLVQTTSNELVAFASSEGQLRCYVREDDNNWSHPFVIQSDQGPIEGITGVPAFIHRVDNIFDLVVIKEAELFHYTLEDQPFLTGVWTFITKLNPSDQNRQLKPISLSLTQNAEGTLELAFRAKPSLVQEDDFMVGYVFDLSTNTWQPAVDLKDEEAHFLIARDGLNIRRL